MVAKSFQSMEQIGEPFESKGRMYVTVKNQKTGNTRVVRWYTEKEYNKMYPAAPVAETGFVNLKHALGFDKGYITIFSNSNAEAYQEFFSRSNARYHGKWGWYVVSTEEVPENLPKLVVPVKLTWESVAADDRTLKSDNEIQKVLKNLFHSNPNVNMSRHFGEIGKRYDFELTISDIIPVNTGFGQKIIYVMIDEKGNKFKWLTSVKPLTLGQKWKFRGTVKAFIEEYGDEITVLTRCM